ncbi:MAG: RIP metalloprotease RseP [Pseudomonadales bacterium]|jgi:regulator of sigma E protease|nr:RIP metalloprotease RseP [Pseudomonadales bacterium]
MDLLQTILALVVTLGILVTVHELGHFLVARYYGVRVLRFSVGMGPALWSRRARSGTEYMIAALPIGGYVKMLDEREGEVPEALRHEAFTAKPPGQRIAISLGGPVANFLLAVVVYWLVFVTGVSGFAPVIGAVDPQTPAGRAGLPAHVEIVAVDGEETRTWQAVNGALVERLGETGTITLSTRVPGTERVDRHELVIERWLAGADEPDLLGDLGLSPAFPAVLGEVVEDSAAQAAGLRAGDRVLAVDGEPVEGWRDWVARVQAAPDRALEVRIARGEDERVLRLTPEARTVDGETIGFVGTGPLYRTARLGPLDAVPRALEETWDKTAMTLGILKKMVEGLVSTRNLSGPITIAKVAGDSAESGLEAFLSFLALLSVSLGVLNLLPIPVLDGGHVLFYLVELLKGSPVPERVQVLGVQIGIFIVASLMLLAFYNDLTRL